MLEEKILAALEKLQTDISGLKTDVSGLKAGQTHASGHLRDKGAS